MPVVPSSIDTPSCSVSSARNGCNVCVPGREVRLSLKYMVNVTPGSGSREDGMPFSRSVDAPRRPRPLPPEAVEDPGTVEARIKAEKLKQAEFLTRSRKWKS